VARNGEAGFKAVRSGTGLTNCFRIFMPPGPLKPVRPSLKVNAITNIAVMIFGALVAFVITPAMLRYLGERRYGMWTLVSSLVGYFSLLQFGLTSSVFYYVPLFRGKNQPDKVSAVVSSAMAFYLLVGTVVVVAAQLFAVNLARFFGGGPELTALIRVVALAFALGLPANILNTAVKGYEGFAFVNIVTCITLLLRGGLLLACVWAHYSLMAMGWVLVIVNGASLLGQWIAFRRKCPGIDLTLRSVHWNEFRLLLVFGGVILIATTANALAVESPKQIVGKIVSLEALGVFAIPLMMISYYRQLVFTVTRVLTPRFSYFSGRGMKEEIQALFLRSSRYVGIIATAVALIFWVAGPSFLLLWTHRPQMDQAIPALLVLVAGNVVLLTHRVTSDLLLGLGRQGVLAAFEMGEACVIVVLVILLTRHMGVTGAALGMAIPFVVVRGVLQVICVCRMAGVKLRNYYWQCAIGPWFIAGSLLLLGRFLGVSHASQSWASLGIVTLAYLASYAVFSFIFLLTSQERKRIQDGFFHLARRTGGICGSVASTIWRTS